jgi:hypothetical protein
MSSTRKYYEEDTQESPFSGLQGVVSQKVELFMKQLENSKEAY